MYKEGKQKSRPSTAYSQELTPLVSRLFQPFYIFSLHAGLSAASWGVGSHLPFRVYDCCRSGLTSSPVPLPSPPLVPSTWDHILVPTLLCPPGGSPRTALPGRLCELPPQPLQPPLAPHLCSLQGGTCPLCREHSIAGASFAWAAAFCLAWSLRTLPSKHVSQPFHGAGRQH